MLLTSHTLTGLVLSRKIHNPLLLAPAAFASHLVMDSLPHIGHPTWDFKKLPVARSLLVVATVDNLVALGLTIGFVIYQPHLWLQTVVGVGFATLPDLLFLLAVFRKRPISNAFTRFHSRIQWHQSIAGGVVDAVWAVAMLYLLKHGI